MRGLFQVLWPRGDKKVASPYISGAPLRLAGVMQFNLANAERGGNGMDASYRSADATRGRTQTGTRQFSPSQEQLRAGDESSPTQVQLLSSVMKRFLFDRLPRALSSVARCGLETPCTTAWASPSVTSGRLPNQLSAGAASSLSSSVLLLDV